MRLNNMLRHKMGWAAPSGARNEVALSSRVRLARNLQGFPFPGRAKEKSSAAVLAEALGAVSKSKALDKAAHIRLDDLDPIDRLFLVERHLISRNLAVDPRSRAVAVSERDRLSVMINEEDHLRLQSIDSGLCLKELLRQASALDDELSRGLSYAFHPEWGYLAACPTNTGTGMRASTLVHLPGLALTGQINRVLDELARLGAAARGLYGEGTQVLGDFYQISNSAAMGSAEEELAERITRVVNGLIDQEIAARRALWSGAERPRMEDLVWRSLGALMNARMMTYEEAMQHLSCVRMAISLGMKVPAQLKTVNELIVLSQPAHIQMAAGKELDSSDRDFLRAALLRKKFG